MSSGKKMLNIALIYSAVFLLFPDHRRISLSGNQLIRAALEAKVCFLDMVSI